ncbi:DUF192 domain-containing protein [bacterium]|nr:DUF192 domain-containing protein [bacterium]
MRLLTYLFCGCFILCSAYRPLFAAEIWNIKIKDKVISVEIAQSETEQQMGLGNRFALAEGSGMLFTYRKPGNRVFWMKRMHFAIDILWLLQGKIVHIEENVPPPESGTPDSNLKLYGKGIVADMVLEVPAGYTRRNKINTGDTVQIKNR